MLKTFKKIKLGLLIPLLLLGVSGCSSYGAARILSEPSGAEVVNLEDESLLGTTRSWFTGKMIEKNRS